MVILQGIEIPEELLASIDPEIIKQLAQKDDLSPDELFLWFSEVLPGFAAQAKGMLSGTYDLSNFKCYQTNTFYPSALMRTSGFYLQTLLDAHFSSNYFTVREGLSSWMLLLTLEGNGHLSYEGKDYELLPGDIFLIDARILQDYRSGPDGWHYRLAHFESGLMEEYYRPIRSFGNVVFPVGLTSSTASHMDELFAINRGPIQSSGNPAVEFKSSLLLQQMVMELLMSLPEYDTARLPDWIQDIYNWIPEHCAENLDLDTISEQFSISKFHLSREFKKYTGRTLIDYVKECRVDRAKLLLRTTAKPIADIAEETGFTDQTTFGRVFARHEKTTPSAYRKEWSQF